MHNKPLSSVELDLYIRKQFISSFEELNIAPADIAFDKIKKIMVGAVSRQHRIDKLGFEMLNDDASKNKRRKEKTVDFIVNEIMICREQAIKEACRKISKGEIKNIDSFILTAKLFSNKIRECKGAPFIFDNVLAFDAISFRKDFLTPTSTKRFIVFNLFSFYEEMLGFELILCQDRSDEKSAGPFQELYVTAEFVLQDLCRKYGLYEFKICTQNTTYNFLFAELIKYKEKKPFTDVFAL